MGTPGPAGPSDETLIMVWKMRTEGRTPAAVAEATGIPVRSVKRYTAKARELLQTVGYLDRRQRIVDVAGERAQAAAVMDMVRTWLVDAVENGTATPVDAALAVIKAEERRAKVLRLDGPDRLELIPGRPAADDPPDDVDEAVRRYRERQAAARGLPPGVLDAELVDQQDDDDDEEEGGTW